MKNIKEIVYSEEGVLNRFRNGNYTISDEEKSTILEFAKKVNSDVKEGKLNPQDFAMYSEIMYFFIHYANEVDDLEELLDEIYGEVQDGLDFEDEGEKE